MVIVKLMVLRSAVPYASGVQKLSSLVKLRDKLDKAALLSPSKKTGELELGSHSTRERKS
jgi:hypothetical protein